jgi:hypothetical protein
MGVAPTIVTFSGGRMRQVVGGTQEMRSSLRTLYVLRILGQRHLGANCWVLALCVDILRRLRFPWSRMLNHFPGAGSEKAGRR